MIPERIVVHVFAYSCFLPADLNVCQPPRLQCTLCSAQGVQVIQLYGPMSCLSALTCLLKPVLPRCCPLAHSASLSGDLI